MTGPTAGGMTGMALAAGLGTRMRPLTDALPKPLISVAGRTLIDRALDQLAACGCDRAVVNVHYLADPMEAHLRARAGAPEILVSDERALLLETGGGLVKAKSLFGSGPVLVTNTDAIFLPDDDDALPRALRGFDPAREDARLVLVAKARAMGLAGRGDFDMTGDGALVLPEKGQAAPYFYTGMQILNPDILEGEPAEPFSMWRLWTRSLEAGRLTGAVFDGEWLHVGDPQGLADAEARLAQERTGQGRRSL